MLKDKIKFVGMLIFLFLVFTACQAWEDRQTIAKVNGEVIKKRPYRMIYQARYQQLMMAHPQKPAALEQRLGKAVLEEMINDMIYLQEARKRNLVPPMEMVDKSLGHVKDGKGPDPTFQKAMKEKGMTLEEIKEEMQRRMAIGALRQQLVQGIQTPEKEAREFYQKNKALFVEPPQYQIGFLFAADQAQAQEYREQLQRGKARFEDLIKNNPPQWASMLRENPAWLDPEGFNPEMKKAVKETKVGTVSSPVKAAGMEGYYIIKIYGKRDSRTRSFKEVKEELELNLNKEKAQAALNNWLTAQRQKAQIEVYENKLSVKVDFKPPAPPPAPSKAMTSPPPAQPKFTMPPPGSLPSKPMMSPTPAHPPIGKSKG